MDIYKEIRLLQLGGVTSQRRAAKVLGVSRNTIKNRMNLIYRKLFTHPSERSSTIVTTNLPFSRWTELFDNSTMVSALVDRLTFRSHVLDMSGPSYRLLAAQADAN